MEKAIKQAKSSADQILATFILACCDLKIPGKNYEKSSIFKTKIVAVNPYKNNVIFIRKSGVELSSHKEKIRTIGIIEKVKEIEKKISEDFGKGILSEGHPLINEKLWKDKTPWEKFGSATHAVLRTLTDWEKYEIDIKNMKNVLVFTQERRFGNAVDSIGQIQVLDSGVQEKIDQVKDIYSKNYSN